MAGLCEHLEQAPPGEGARPVAGCEDCLRIRSSPRRHATAHHGASGHPVVVSAEPGETWRWCFVDRAVG